MKNIQSIIIGTGSHDSSLDTILPNSHFEMQTFYDAKGNPMEKPSEDIVRKFEEITGTRQRHYAAEGKVTSDLAIEAAKNAVTKSTISPTKLDCIIVANNFGDIVTSTDKMDLVPTFAARIKNYLQIVNPAVVAYDIVIGGLHSYGEFKQFERYMGLTNKDLVIHVHNHEQEDMFEIAEYLLPNCSVDKESLNSIIVVHYTGQQSSIANKVKDALNLQDHDILAYDLYFGCPGFLQGMIHADTMIKNGHVTHALVVGAEILSKVAEPEDMDTMLYGDGAGAVIMQAIESDVPVGFISYKVRSDTFNQQAFMLRMGHAYSPNHPADELFLKMTGTRVHKHALNLIPTMIKDALREANLTIDQIDLMVFHQPNPLMLKEIALRTYALFDMQPPEHIMPIIGDTFGNPSVASIPLILHQIDAGQLENYSLRSGDIVMLLSIGAGMNINIALYRQP